MNVHNRNRITCRPNNNYKIEGEVECIKACSFPEQIANGKRVETGRENHHVGEYWAKYECDDGYVLREGERGRWARCSTEEKNGTKTAVAKLPQCKPVDTCKFPDSIGKACKWEEKTNDEGKKHAYYRCPEGMDLHGESQLRCKANETSQVDMRDIKCVERKKCAFPDKIEFGYKVQNKTYDHNALYRCDEGYHIQGSEWASCNKTTGKDIRLPKCVKGSGSEDDCHLPESIEGGKRAEKHHNRARYECHGEWRLPDSLKKTEGWVMCKGKEHQPDKPHCVKGEPGQCEFPKVIFAGYKMRDGEHNGQKYAVYQCIPPYVMTPNKDSFWGYMKAENKTANEAYMQMAYTAGCHEGKAYLPSCVDPRRAMHCGLPNYIEGGKAVGFMSLEEWMKEHGKGKDHKDDNNKDKEEEKEKEKEKEKEEEKEKEKEKGKEEGKEGMDDEMKKLMSMMPVAAKYQCYDGMKMHKTMKGDMGWCRKDGSFEVPRCESVKYWSEIQFKLHNGKENRFEKNGKAFAGMVLARNMSSTKALSDWEFGCNDGFNHQAAGAICRSLGWKHGAQTPLTKKMVDWPSSMGAKPKFGWTRFHCRHDDVMTMSESCKAMRYEDGMKEMGMKSRCFDFDRIAVKCFDHAMFNVTMGLTHSNTKITCKALAEKERFILNLSKMKDVKTKFMMDDKEIPGVKRYRIKKGFFMKHNLKNKTFKCLSCEIHAGDFMIGKAEKCKD